MITLEMIDDSVKNNSSKKKKSAKKRGNQAGELP